MPGSASPSTGQALSPPGYRLNGGPAPTCSRNCPATRTQECPACGNDGVVEGDDGEQQSFEYLYDREDGSPIGAEARLEVPVVRFCCETCHLVLDDYELIKQAGLPDSFEFVDNNPEWPEEEPEYGND